MDVFNIGQEILDSVQDAVNRGDFSDLSRKISNAVNSGGDSRYWSVKTSQTQSSGYSRTTTGTGDTRQTTTALSPYVSKAPGTTSGLVMEIVGFSLTGLNFLSMLGMAAAAAVTGIAVGSVAVLGVMTLTTFGIGIAGFNKRGRAKRYKQYVQKLAGKDYCAIEDMARSVGRKKEFVQKDLQVMVDKQFFREGAFDEKKTTFMGTYEVYKQYLAARESMRQREAQEARKREEEEKIYGRPGMTEESRKLLREGNAHIQHIRECNDAIPGEEISAKLYRLEEIMTRIFKQVEKQPDLAPDLRKFMNYYLPTTSKLVEAYRELDAQPIEGENISRTKREIEDTLDTINEAFEKLLDSFFEEKAWDISSDISVMKSMLKQDGMTGRDFSTGQ